MLNDVYLIIMTAFALFGLYCLILIILEIKDSFNMPPSILIVKDCNDDKTFTKVKLAQEKLPNNYTVLYPFDTAHTDEQQKELLYEYIKELMQWDEK